MRLAKSVKYSVNTGDEKLEPKPWETAIAKMTEFN